MVGTLRRRWYCLLLVSGLIAGCRAPTPAPVDRLSTYYQAQPTEAFAAHLPPPPPPAKEGWIWPVRGPILSTFDPNNPLKRGVDVGGHMGTPILAARSGVVVYAGDRLRGYGQLVILKHGEYLSAYAHNQTLLVKEGESVRVGQVIATMGDTESDCVKLHFEIRFQGKPVDPGRFLPPMA